MARIIAPVALAGVLFGTFELLIQATWPPQSSLVGVTAIVACSLVAEAGGGLVAAGRGRQVGLRSLGIAACVVALGGVVFPTAAFWALALILGWSKPIRTEHIQRLAHPSEQAQSESWAGVIDMAATAILLPIAASAYPRLGEDGAIAVILGMSAGMWAVLIRRWARALEAENQRLRDAVGGRR